MPGRKDYCTVFTCNREAGHKGKHAWFDPERKPRRKPRKKPGKKPEPEVLPLTYTLGSSAEENDPGGIHLHKFSFDEDRCITCCMENPTPLDDFVKSSLLGKANLAIELRKAQFPHVQLSKLMKGVYEPVIPEQQDLATELRKAKFSHAPSRDPISGAIDLDGDAFQRHMDWHNDLMARRPAIPPQVDDSDILNCPGDPDEEYRRDLTSAAEAYSRRHRLMDKTFGIGRAIKEMRKGKKVSRSGWNGPGQFLTMQVPDSHSKMTLPYVYITTVQDDLVPWLCSQTDLLARDWYVVT